MKPTDTTRILTDLIALDTTANTQGKTLAETKQNLIEAVALVLQANREFVGKPNPE